MAKKRKLKPAKRGVRLHPGKRWRLIKLGNNSDAMFIGTLLGTHNLAGGQRIAIFSVPKRKN